MKKVPLKDFLLFKKECLCLQKEWGLLGWQIFFNFQPLDSNVTAQTDVDLMSHAVTLSFSSEVLDENKDEIDPIDDARHEMLHLLLWRMSAYGYARFVTIDQIKEAEHEVIMTLLKIIP